MFDNELMEKAALSVHKDMQEALCSKIRKEYNAFIANIKKESVEVVIESAYEIHWKDTITLYCEERNFYLSEKYYNALLSAENTLELVYTYWEQNAALHISDDIAVALERTAAQLIEVKESENYFNNFNNGNYFYREKSKKNAKVDFNNGTERQLSKNKCQQTMYEVTIRETLERTVYVTAKDWEEAENIVKERWANSEYVLDSDDFVWVQFEARISEKENEID